jgi:hypothetical protein
VKQAFAHLEARLRQGPASILAGLRSGLSQPEATNLITDAGLKSDPDLIAPHTWHNCAEGGWGACGADIPRAVPFQTGRDRETNIRARFGGLVELDGDVAVPVCSYHPSGRDVVVGAENICFMVGASHE